MRKFILMVSGGTGIGLVCAGLHLSQATTALVALTCAIGWVAWDIRNTRKEGEKR